MGRYQPTVKRRGWQWSSFSWEIAGCHGKRYSVSQPEPTNIRRLSEGRLSGFCTKPVERGTMAV